MACTASNNRVVCPRPDKWRELLRKDFSGAVRVVAEELAYHLAAQRPPLKQTANPIHILRSKRAVTRRREPKSGFKHPREMRLVCKTRLECYFDQRSLPSDLFTCKIKSPHEQIAVGACPTHLAKLARKIVACEPCHRF